MQAFPHTHSVVRRLGSPASEFPTALGHGVGFLRARVNRSLQSEFSRSKGNWLQNVDSAPNATLSCRFGDRPQINSLGRKRKDGRPR